MGFLRTIAIIVLIYYALKFIGRLAAPFLVKKMADKMNQNFQNRQTPNGQQETRKPEGEVTVESKQSRKSKLPKSEGEYVDFEEVND